MADELVLDASILGRCFFNENGSEAARAAVLLEAIFIAPDLIHLEIASLSVKKLRLGHTTADVARRAVEAVDAILAETIASRRLAARAFALAAAHGFSAYDAAYLALAEMRGATLLTADVKLARRANDCGLGALVREL